MIRDVVNKIIQQCNAFKIQSFEIRNRKCLFHFGLSCLHEFFVKSQTGLESHFCQKDRSEIQTGLNIFKFTSPAVM